MRDEANFIFADAERRRRIRGRTPLVRDTNVNGSPRTATLLQHTLLFQECENMLELLVQGGLRESMPGLWDGDQPGIGAGLFQLSCQVRAMLVRNCLISIAMNCE